ncbi:Homocysteine-responsive endoplasmic reticulum-resident ubiquitin-like domain member 1 protein [Saguinus oedipus]|uniref:Homocysteine-responsive endoplasmic reticulum-resident ubiquitin-like domain member 1 protein n=1 Tax=Saguinus oedipus TaxID=9490 RepID=A0ABQ9TKQ2_SAGOE|nr:Homocysteine-responsive endoplasmic reticulum-resident ubiquitin-like domain member 1 protein [Saguinus oedipus]
MESEPDPEPVTLLVKSPNQRHRDLELSGDRSWSVGHLKAHLSRVYPERPAVAPSPPLGTTRPPALPCPALWPSPSAGLF